MGFLAQLLPQVRAEIGHPDYLRGLPPGVDRPRRSLAGAIAGAPDGWAVLVERKHESPGNRESTLPPTPLDRFVDETRAGGADGLSCIATGPVFRGSPREVAALAQAASQPVLFKDFVVDPIQLEAASRAGAAAVLLIARLETGGFLDRPLRELADEAHRRSLEVLLELHAPEEWSVAATVPSDVVGVNLRDLDTLEFHPALAQRTFAAGNHDRPMLGLSGVSDPSDARRYRAWGADGLLVGTGFARARDPRGFLRSLRVPRPGGIG